MKGKKGGVAMQQHHEGLTPMIGVGAAVGAVIGGAVGAAAAAALSNEDTRKKVGDAVNTLQKQAADRFEQMAKNVREKSSKTDNAVMDAKRKAD